MNLRNLIPAVASLTVLAACSEGPSAPDSRPSTIFDAASASALQSGFGPLMTVVVDPLDPNTETHTFDELPLNCAWDATIPNPYEGLSFLSTPYYGVCNSGNGTRALVPVNSSTLGSVTEVLIDLPEAASTVSIDAEDNGAAGVTLNGYDASGALVASEGNESTSDWTTIAISGDIHRIGLAMDQGGTFLDNLTITYDRDPTDKDGCKKGGWEAFGFKNQGQCVRFVETGKDSR